MRIRIKFSKNSSVKYLGHLDIMRSFQKFFNRADIRMMYSEGFNPHQKMSFALPLGVGIESCGEYLDADVQDGQDMRAIRDALDKASGSGFDIIDVREIKEPAEKSMAAVRYAAYEIYFEKPYELDIDKYLQSDNIIVEKTTKTGTKSIDIKPMIIRMSYENQTISLLIKAGSSDNIKPEIVIVDLFGSNGIEFRKDLIRIKRTDLFAEGIIPLIEYQTK